MEKELLKYLQESGAAGLVIVVVLLFLRHLNQRDQNYREERTAADAAAKQEREKMTDILVTHLQSTVTAQEKAAETYSTGSQLAAQIHHDASRATSEALGKIIQHCEAVQKKVAT